MSDEGDAKILNEVQDRFDVNITELPDEIDLSSYSKLTEMEVLSYTLPNLHSSYILEGRAVVGFQRTRGQLHMYVQGSLMSVLQYWNPIGHSMTTPPPLLSPSSIFLPP